MYWLITTAPPDARAVNRFINIVLKTFTREPPETAVSPAKPTIKTSEIPTRATNNCSKNKGIINLFKSSLENICITPLSSTFYTHFSTKFLALSTLLPCIAKPFVTFALLQVAFILFFVDKKILEK